MSEQSVRDSFLGYPRMYRGDRLEADIAIFGAPHGTPYKAGKISHCADAPAAIRLASERDQDRRHHFDFDWGGSLPDAQQCRVVDCGNVTEAHMDPEENRKAIHSTTKEILKVGAVPVMLGGDDSVPIPFVEAFENQGPVWVVQVDAHLDWCNERDGERLGWSSPMRRISEMNHIEGMVQVGMRGIGSSRDEDLQAARDWGSHIFSAGEIHSKGVEAAVSLVPEGAQVIITFDVDGLDPAFFPALNSRAPGGLTYTQGLELIQGVGQQARIAGFDLVELMPPRDLNGMSALTAYRIVANAIAAIMRGIPDTR